ncbi:ABC1 kinase family protein [Candidatus Methanoperedens nitratireducens]|uniref:Serine/threonine protein kinase n=1 Tax=Candidatus Methanoperedens nitratireducens TaxID=1392998 RepID=A0A284VML2_9EURY|nr:AarF/ABC1/UbiB kinase family protein [Candidatus Methanoperedens nitroreducens]SNQ60515.1 Serine/threonine protein kinase [Candidatus Methanoperedens nitroreducens]
MDLLDRENAYVKRYRKIVNVLVRYGFGYLVDRFRLRPLRSLRERITGQEPLREQLLALSEAERLRLALEELGTTFIKFGQILSTRYDIVPEEFINEMVKLQDRVPPFDYSEVKRVIENEFRRSIEEIFLSFDPEPIAAASIGQVHRARLPGGEEAAVKVMRPGIERMIEIDLSILMSLAKFAEKHVKESRSYNVVGFVEEFSRIIRLEIDYIHEARNADNFYLNFEGSTTVRIPRIYWKYITKHALTMEYLEGIKVSDLEQLEGAGHDKKRISRILTNAYLKMIFEDGFYHADPHPGNILVSRDETIVFLDFGMAGYVDPVLRENLADIMIAIRKNDIDLLIESIIELGLISHIGAESPMLRIQLEELVNRYYGLSIKFTDPIEFLQELIRIISKSGGIIPTNVMLLSKTLSIVNEINRKLDPDYNFAELAEPYFNKIIQERTGISYLTGETTKIAWDFIRLVKAFPKRINHILAQAEKGTLKIELEHRGLETVTEKLDVVSNRLSFSLIIAALIVGSSLIIQTRMSPSLWGVPLLGVFGYLLAGIFGMGLIISILRSGKW